MPWKECHIVDERLRFIARLVDGEKMSVVCEDFGISRKTGYKIFDRYRDAGLGGLTDRSRRPHRHANQLPMAVEKLVVVKKEYPHWGAPKLRERLKQRWPDQNCYPCLQNEVLPVRRRVWRRPPTLG
jgi:putative transposase